MAEKSEHETPKVSKFRWRKAEKTDTTAKSEKTETLEKPVKAETAEKSGEKSDPETPKVASKWRKAIVGVRAITSAKGPPKDPFLDRFTVTGRSYSAENEAPVYHFKDLFTTKFWKTIHFDPSTTGYFYWSMVIMFAVLYNLMIIILRCVFIQPNEQYLVMFITLDYICDTLYLIDMFCKSRLGFLESGLLVRDVPRLTKMYLKSKYLVLDIITLLPFDILYIVPALKFGTYVRFNRLVRIWRLKEFFHMAETHTNFPNIIRIANLILYIIIIIHWFGCFYFQISYTIGFGTDDWVYPSLANPGYEKFWQQYSMSFYWSTLTLTTIGDTVLPHTVEEIWFCTGCSLMGVLIFATIFGNVGAMINHMDALRTEFQNKVDNVKTYMDLRGIGPELQERVIKWFDYTWNNKQSVDDKESLMFLPEKLRAEISIHVHMHTLRRVAIFQDCEPGLLVELVLKLKLQVYSPGDFICKKGDIGKEMYIVKRGKLQVVSDDGTKVFVTMSDGAVFGEISVLNIAGNKTANRRTANVKTVGYSDLFCLTKNDLWAALEEYPEAKKMLIAKGKQLLRKDKLLDEEMAAREEKRQTGMITKVDMLVEAVEEIKHNLEKLNEKIDKSPAGLRPINVSLLSDNARSSLTSLHNLDKHKMPSTIPEEDEKKQEKKESEKKEPDEKEPVKETDKKEPEQKEEIGEASKKITLVHVKSKHEESKETKPENATNTNANDQQTNK
ncbi:cyclic nucleotide-gated cation channel alpha-3-like isoform X2 [Dreissena polymorpha]|uniref:Cyclic nucleotide-binding domain-containing protein n=1 Tax=Dreissena polymorpha TaxID=45954 RepID=A0A9D4QM40_DREPO|nr:cyclic nucleotide-gated cation channel alpha-3-like isoform X2 [Dreissena polymorpha]KAH3835140.1 hypothetical protein DPMN_108483 [Dreissena polymorpha]